MSIIKKLLSLFLAAAIALPLISGCGETGKTVSDTSVTEPETVAEVTTDPNDRSGYKDNLPADLDFGGMTIGVFPALHTEGDSLKDRKS